jgi:hypothetical protein
LSANAAYVRMELAKKKRRGRKAVDSGGLENR